MEKIKNEIELLLKNTEKENERKASLLTDTCSLLDYAPNGEIWTTAFQNALNEHEIVIIPKKDTPYYIDSSVKIPSNRKILADKDATICLCEGTDVLALRNEKTKDGTHEKITGEKNENISIEGGVWKDWCPHRMGYGKSGKYDTSRTFFGVSTFMLFNNLDRLTLKNMTFVSCGGFAVQLGDISNVVIENIEFISCYADGIHVNGNTKNIYIKNVRGEVGDDLVALNMYDWQNSSINFGPCENVICQDLFLSPSSHYKAMRIEPGIYKYANGETLDCALYNAIIRRVENIKTFKLYCQTPPYTPPAKPEWAEVGSGDNIFFEDIKIDLDSPIDPLDEYLNSHELKGTFAGFEFGLNAKSVYLKNVDITLHREKYPLSYLACIGPKSVRFENGTEVFDPYFSSTVENLHIENVTVNGQCPTDISPYVKEICFDKLYDDIESSGKGKFENIIYKENPEPQISVRGPLLK